MTADEQLDDILRYLLEAADSALLHGDLDKDDRELIASARQELFVDGQTLRAIAGALRAADHGEYRVEALARLIGAITDVASRSILTDPTWKHVKRTTAEAQAQLARQARVDKRISQPREKSIVDEIAFETTDWDGSHSSKLAGIISQNLETKHGVTISPRAVRDRLEKWKLLKSVTDENGSA